jgi:hypothetical protein
MALLLPLAFMVPLFGGLRRSHAAQARLRCRLDFRKQDIRPGRTTTM